MTKLTDFYCENCQNNNPDKAYCYDGGLGYEAYICTCCGYYYDNFKTGQNKADDFSNQFKH